MIGLPRARGRHASVHGFAAAAVCALAATATAVPAAAQDVAAEPHANLSVPASVAALDFSADARLLLVGEADGRLSVWDLETRDTLLATAATGGLHFAAFLAGDTALVAVGEDGEIRIRPVHGVGDEVRLRAGRPERVALDAARRFLAVASRRGRIEIFDLPTRQRVGVIDGRREVDELLFLGFDRHGRQLVAVARDGRMIAWNPATLEPLRRVTLRSAELTGSRSRVHAAGADAGANILVAAIEEVALPRGGLRGRARPGDLERRDQLLVFDWHSGAEIRRVAHPDGVLERLVVGPGNDHVTVARDAAVSLVDLRRGERGASVRAPAAVTRLAVSADHGWLAVGSRGGDVGVWRLQYRPAPEAGALADAAPGISGRLRILGDASPAIQPDSPITLAVLPFDERSGEGGLGLTLAELLTTQLANVEHLTLVERLRVEALLDELELQRRGVTEADGLQLGRMLNADYVLLGSIGASGTSHTFSARLLRVETGEVVSGRQVLCEECRAQDLFEAIHLLGTAIAR